MAKLTKAAIIAKYNGPSGVFADNTFSKTEEVDFRTLVQDFTDSLAAQSAVETANVPDYEAGRFYPQGFVILHNELLYAALKMGNLPAPTGAASDPNWGPALAPVPDLALSQAGRVPAVQQLASAGGLKTGRLYLLLSRQNAQGQALPDVYARALTPYELEPTAYAVTGAGASAVRQLVNYDLATDSTAPVAVAGGGNGTAVFTGADATTGALSFQLPAGASTNAADYKLLLIKK